MNQTFGIVQLEEGSSLSSEMIGGGGGVKGLFPRFLITAVLKSTSSLPKSL